MIKLRLNKFYAVACLFVALLIVPHSHGSNFEKSLDNILMLSGLTDQVEQLPELMKLGMQESRGQSSALPDSVNALLIASIDQTILSAEIIEMIKGSLRDYLSVEDIEQLLKWYESDLGKKITSLEANSSSVETDKNILALEEELLANTERLAFAKRFDQLLGATDMNIELQKHSSIAIFSALMTASNPDDAVDMAPIVKKIETLSEQSRPVIEKDVILSFIYTYQDIDTSKLKQYEDFLNQESSRKFNTMVVKSMGTAIEKSISKWATSLASIFQHKGATAL
jgi:DNA-binding transcriptional MerR regulator